ncbi:hypothetical protein D0Y65_026693 [Glycine soja]|uniref:Uncharacterized protein n=1 Tax=Glycine soja TaxID=3848 RepID=A0A445IKZ9_GLYSO|nr:hypothetical protein D0Y65_026693 [Glycine soja]
MEKKTERRTRQREGDETYLGMVAKEKKQRLVMMLECDEHDAQMHTGTDTWLFTARSGSLRPVEALSPLKEGPDQTDNDGHDSTDGEGKVDEEIIGVVVEDKIDPNVTMEARSKRCSTIGIGALSPPLALASGSMSIFHKKEFPAPIHPSLSHLITLLYSSKQQTSNSICSKCHGHFCVDEEEAGDYITKPLL